MSEWFGASWQTIGYVVTGTVAMYCSTFIAARIAGRRTLAQLSAFDTIITIAIGSLLATTSVSRDASYAQGAAALVTLLGLQLVVAAARRRIGALRRAVDFAPQLVVRDGQMHLDQSVFGAQLTPGELESALRQQGVFDVSKACVVVLEPSGKMSVAVDPDATKIVTEALERGRDRSA